MERYSKIYAPGLLSYTPLESTPSMYTSELSHSPMGDYGSSEADFHSQKGPLYQEFPLDEEVADKLSMVIPGVPEGWNFYKLLGLALIIISAGAFFYSSGWFEKYQLQTYGLVAGFFLFVAN